MMIQLGRVCELVRYPVKSMAGTMTESASLGWHGLNGDRRFAFRRLGDASGFPWLSASRHPELLLYRPFGLDESSGEPLPTHVCTPAGTDLELQSPELQSEIAQSCGINVELMKLKHGIFDDGSVSVISLGTIAAIGRAAGVDLDRRRFRANIVLETPNLDPFLEDAWVGGTLVFGEREPIPAVSVTTRDARCMMLNLDPDTARQDGRVLKTVVRLNANNAGVYGTVVRPGTIHVGQTVSLVSVSRR
jgi:MOSC domain-containing protein